VYSLDGKQEACDVKISGSSLQLLSPSDVSLYLGAAPAAAAHNCPDLAMSAFCEVAPLREPTFSSASTTACPDLTLPKTTCFPLRCEVIAVVMKNCEPCVLRPAFAIESRYLHAMREVISGTQRSFEVISEAVRHPESRYLHAMWEVISGTQRSFEVISEAARHPESRSLLLAVGQVEVLVVELATVDGLASAPIAAREVASLYHEPGDDAVKARALVVQRLATEAVALLARA
jgi:hypothetical protein